MFVLVIVANGDSNADNSSTLSLNNAHIAIYTMLGVFIIVIIRSYIYSKYISINDFYKVGALIKAAIHINDTLSDILFILNITEQPEYPSIVPMLLLIASIFFVVLPVIMSLYQLHHEINKWKRNYDLGQWITENITILYALSMITGSSFCSVELCTSNLFNLNKFDMPLNQMELHNFQNKKICTMVLGEV